ncbi:MAG: hypothetical protein EPN23_05195 [Verrucomicrobia bacterium]|nr:MAG: hypothetical protein EPN23_05195 [Verrucomicrobiota bacterium]
MRFLRSTAVLLCAALALAGGLSACGKKKSTPAPASGTSAVAQAQSRINPQATAVTVDGHLITWGEVLNELQRLRSINTGSATVQQAADNLVLRQLLSQAAEQTKLTVLPQEIAARMDAMRRQVPTNTTLEAVLRSNGITEATFRASIINTLKIDQLLKQHTQKVATATDVEINQFLKDNPNLLHVPETVSVRTILVATQPTDDAATRATKKSRAESIRKQLLGGADFARFAATLSDDPSKIRGGQLPAIQRGVVPDQVFETAAFSQKVGELGPVLETRYGYVLLQVQKRTPGKVLKLGEVKERVRTLVTDRKRQQVLQDYAKALRAKAKIVYAEAR